MVLDGKGPHGTVVYLLGKASEYIMQQILKTHISSVFFLSDETVCESSKTSGVLALKKTWDGMDQWPCRQAQAILQQLEDRLRLRGWTPEKI